MIKGLIFDLDDTLTIHDELYDPNYLRIIREFFPDYKNNDLVNTVIMKNNWTHLDLNTKEIYQKALLYSLENHE